MPDSPLRRLLIHRQVTPDSEPDPATLHRLASEIVRSRPDIAPEPVDETWPEGPGGLLVRLLANRNIHPWNARLLLEVGDGPYVSNSTIVLLGRGRATITPQYVTAFAHLPGLPAADLAVLTGVEPAERSRPHPHRAELAEVAWDARRLTEDQLLETRRLVDAVLEADPRLYCPRCRKFHRRDTVPQQILGSGDALVAEFEQRLDALLARLSPGAAIRPAPADADPVAARDHRIVAKQRRVSGELLQRLADIPEVLDLVLDAIVHDSWVGYSRELVTPLVKAGRHRTVLDRLSTVVATGAPQQKLCAMHARPWAKLDGADPDPAFETVCLKTFVECGDPVVRAELSYRFTLDQRRHPRTLADTVQQARKIAESDPGRYPRLLSP